MPLNPSFFHNPREAHSPQMNSPQLLCLRGQEGTLACRVHDPISTTVFPQRSPRGRLRYGLLSEEKMGNLTAVRGIPGAAMVGPADYFCDLERSDQYLISINIGSEGMPSFDTHSLDSEPNHQAELLNMLEEEQLTKVKAQWFSGSNRDMLHQKLLEYKHQKNQVFS